MLSSLLFACAAGLFCCGSPAAGGLSFLVAVAVWVDEILNDLADDTTALPEED